MRRLIPRQQCSRLEEERRSTTHHIDGNNFSCGLLDLAQFAKEVPEARFGDHIVGREDPHAVELGLRLLVGWQLAADDLVLLEASHGFSKRMTE